MTDQGSQFDETAPIAAVPAEISPVDLAKPFASAPTPVTRPLTPPGLVPAVAPPPAPVATPAPGWYPLHGHQRYWDGHQWTEHTAPAVVHAVPIYRPVYQAPLVVTDARTNGAEVTIAWILTVLSFGYLLPWAIAATRGKSNSAAVGLVNLLLGWTFIGWIVALVMACTSHQVAFVQHHT